jgi:hypothetical protein
METAEVLNVLAVLRPALVRLNDKNLRNGLTKGFYIGLAQDALESLAIKTFYFETYVDRPMPTNFIDTFPNDFFNVRKLYAFNSSCCSPKSSANIYWKRNFNNQPNGQGYTALNKDDEQSLDPFYKGFNGSFIYGNANMKLFAGAQNGMIMFSSSCSGYSDYRFEYNGMGGDVNKAPVIPRVFRKYIQDYIVREGASALLASHPKSAWGKIRDLANESMMNRINGSWWEAVDFVKTSDTWKKDGLEVYQEHPNI